MIHCLFVCLFNVSILLLLFFQYSVYIHILIMYYHEQCINIFILIFSKQHVYFHWCMTLRYLFSVPFFFSFFIWLYLYLYDGCVQFDDAMNHNVFNVECLKTWTFICAKISSIIVVIIVTSLWSIIYVYCPIVGVYSL